MSSAIVSQAGTYHENRDIASISNPRVFHDRATSEESFGFLTFKVCTKDSDCKILGFSADFSKPYAQTKTGVIGGHSWSEAQPMVCGIKSHYPHKKDIPITYRQDCDDYIPCASDRNLTICQQSAQSRPNILKILACGFSGRAPVKLTVEIPKTISVKYSRWWRAPAAIASLPLGVTADVISAPLQATYYSNTPNCELDDL